MRWCVIVTHGRSGSTLLKDLLNTDPSCRIYGENNNFFFQLNLAHQAAADAQRFSPGWSGSNDPWDGIEDFAPQRLLPSLRRMIENDLLQLDQEKVVLAGFKEIRFFADKEGFVMEPSKMPGYIAFLHELLSPVTFIHLTRNVDEVANSGWFRRQENAHLLEAIPAFNANTREILKQYLSFEIEYNELTNCESVKLEALFETLGLRYDRDKIADALSFRHGTGRALRNAS